MSKGPVLVYGMVYCNGLMVLKKIKERNQSFD